MSPRGGAGTEGAYWAARVVPCLADVLEKPAGPGGEGPGTLCPHSQPWAERQGTSLSQGGVSSEVQQILAAGTPTGFHRLLEQEGKEGGERGGKGARRKAGDRWGVAGLDVTRSHLGPHCLLKLPLRLGISLPGTACGSGLS